MARGVVNRVQEDVDVPLKLPVVKTLQWPCRESKTWDASFDASRSRWQLLRVGRESQVLTHMDRWFSWRCGNWPLVDPDFCQPPRQSSCPPTSQPSQLLATVLPAC